MLIGANENEGGRGANTAALLPPTCLADTMGRGGVGGGGVNVQHCTHAVALPLPSWHETLPRLGSAPLISSIEGLAGMH